MICATYMVKCSGTCGGWLVTGRPMISHEISTKFSSAELARKAAVAVGWGTDQKCPPCREAEKTVAQEEIEKENGS